MKRNELNHYWSIGKMQKRLMVRWWNHRIRNPLYWFRRSAWEFWLKTSPGHNGYCYCPCGSTTDLRITVTGIGIWISLSRDTTKRPCVCDNVVAELYPEVRS